MDQMLEVIKHCFGGFDRAQQALLALVHIILHRRLERVKCIFEIAEQQRMTAVHIVCFDHLINLCDLSFIRLPQTKFIVENFLIASPFGVFIVNAVIERRLIIAETPVDVAGRFILLRLPTR